MGLTVLDADVLIGVMSKSDAQHRRARTLILTALTESSACVMSAITVAEIMVGPMARGDTEGESARRFIEGLRAEIVPLDADRARKAAAIRSRTGLKLPDACVIAAALEMQGRQPDPVHIASFDKRLLAVWQNLSRSA